MEYATIEAPKPPIWELDGKPLDRLFRTLLGKVVPAAEQQQLYENVLRAFQAVVIVDTKQKKNGGEQKEDVLLRQLKDPFHIWWISKFTRKPSHEEEPEDLPSTLGGKMAQLSIGGWINAMAGVADGVVRTNTPAKVNAQQLQAPAGVEPAVYATQLLERGTKMHRLVQGIVQEDIWRTTPERIRAHLAPDMSPSEFSTVRRRICDTLFHGKGLHQEEESDLATAPITGQHDAEKYKKCPQCGNVDQSQFALDRKNGDIICQNCGVVVTESLMHEGSAYRKFEGEEDRNHHGDAPNKLYSNAHNMGTSLSGVAPSTGAGIGGWGSSKGGNAETVLKNTHAYIELNLSNYGKKDRKTRIGYKDKQKKEAFVQMQHTGDALSLHEAVVQRAKELFAGFRDDRELVQQFKGVLAACLCEAFDELAKEGKVLVKGVGANALETEPAQLSGRAARRNELHHVTMAGKGGLQLESTKEKSEMKEDLKPVAQWDLEDCRSWLLEACVRIAKDWVIAREAAPISKKGQWPSGNAEEIEGTLVNHALTLCVHLEEKLKGNSSNGKVSRVTTPRVQDMSKLGIRWQHSHERGSGGKGGVGGSGVQKGSSGRKAGQILFLVTADKLSNVLKDRFVGNSFHKEIRHVFNTQQSKKRKLLLEEASRKRFKQMQRKGWLQARAKVET